MPMLRTPGRPGSIAAQAPLHQAISFSVGGEEYACDIALIQEMIGWVEPKPMPDAAPFLRGVVNLRGIVTPVFDLGARFGRGQTEATATHVLIIVQVGGRPIALLVDAVLDILDYDPAALSAPPALGRSIAEEYLTGMLALPDNRIVALVDLERLLSGPGGGHPGGGQQVRNRPAAVPGR
jgi:purine-binding chemotaxis protein CheW